MEKFITNFEPVFQKFGSNDRTKMRNKLVNMITNYKNTPNNTSKVDKIIKKQFAETKAFLKSNPSALEKQIKVKSQS